jgi:biopolymer transport protein ExbD
MADFSPPANPDKGKVKRKIHSTRVDLTHMVDLGFLLITFFIFTYKISEPKSMKIGLPKDTTTDSMKTAASKTLSLLLAGNNNLWYYPGTQLSGVTQTDYVNGLRSVIGKKKEAVGKMFGNPQELVILIKPMDASSFENVVNVLDEMVITGVTRYVLMEPTADELLALKGN